MKPIHHCLPAVFFVTVAMWVFSGLSAHSAERVAFVIGNDTYRHARPLRTAAADATAVAEKLRVQFGFEVILLLNATRDDFAEGFARFLTEARTADSAVVYFAGHGIESAAMASNYLIPIDARLEKEEHLESQANSLDWLLDRLKPLSAPVRLVVLDCCRNNPLEGRTWISGRGSNVGLGAIDLQRLDTATMVVYSAAPGKAARDQLNIGDPHSPFATALLDEIDQPGANALSLFAGVEETVLEITDQTQSPKVFFSGNILPFQRLVFDAHAPEQAQPSSSAAPAPMRRPVMDAPRPPQAPAIDPAGNWIITEQVTEDQGGWKIDWSYRISIDGPLLGATGRKIRVDDGEPTRGDKAAVSELALRQTGPGRYGGAAIETNYRNEKISASVTLVFDADGRSVSGEMRQGEVIVSRLTGSRQD